MHQLLIPGNAASKLASFCTFSFTVDQSRIAFTGHWSLSAFTHHSPLSTHHPQEIGFVFFGSPPPRFVTSQKYREEWHGSWYNVAMRLTLPEIPEAENTS